MEARWVVVSALFNPKGMPGPPLTPDPPVSFLSKVPRMSIRKTIAILATVLVGTPGVSQSKGGSGYLEPIVPYSPWVQKDLAYKTLIREASPELWMMMLPSFRNPACVVLDRVRGPKVAPHFQLRYAELGKDRTTTNEAKTELPNDAAEIIARAWRKTLMQTRYSEKNKVVNGIEVIEGHVDGVVFEFHYRPDFFGTTWSPQSGPPRLLADLGNALIEFTKKHGLEQERALDRAVELAKQLSAITYN